MLNDIFARLDRGLDLCRVERQGITAKDIDFMLACDRSMGMGRKLTLAREAKLLEIIARVEKSDPE